MLEEYDLKPQPFADEELDKLKFEDIVNASEKLPN